MLNVSLGLCCSIEETAEAPIRRYRQLAIALTEYDDEGLFAAKITGSQWPRRNHHANLITVRAAGTNPPRVAHEV